MARSTRGKKKSNIISLDFTDVESGGGGFKIKPGPYLMKVKTVEDTESDAGNQMFKWTFIGMEKAAKGKLFYMYTVYDPPNSLWKLKSLLEALGTEVPDGALDLDLDEMVDLEMIGHVDDEEYQGKTTSKLQDFSPVDGEEVDEEEEDEEEKPARGKKKRGGAKADAEDEEDEEEEKPTRGKKKVAKKGKKLDAMSADEVKELDEEGMDEVVERYDLEVDLSEHKTPRRKATAIIAALEEKELLAD